MMNSTQIRSLICAGFIAATSLFADEKAAAVQNLKATEISAALKKDEKIIILDVRTATEYAEGHLAGAKNIDFLAKDFGAKIAKLDPKKTYVVHCKSGGRSGRSMKQFKAKGFVKILHMSDGYLGWIDAKLPIKK